MIPTKLSFCIQVSFNNSELCSLLERHLELLGKFSSVFHSAGQQCGLCIKFQQLWLLNGQSARLCTGRSNGAVVQGRAFFIFKKKISKRLISFIISIIIAILLQISFIIFNYRIRPFSGRYVLENCLIRFREILPNKGKINNLLMQLCTKSIEIDQTVITYKLNVSFLLQQSFLFIV